MVINKRKGVALFLIFIVTVPTSASLSIINLKFGVSFCDGLAIGIFFGYALQGKSNKAVVELPFYLVLLLLLYTIYVSVSLVTIDEYKYLLKDLRPLIQIILFWMLYEFSLKHAIRDVREKTVLKFLLYAFVIVFVKVGYQSLKLGSINDVYYDNNSYRYLDAVSYVAALFLIYCFSPSGSKLRNNGALFVLVVIAAFACVLVANSRFLLLSIFTVVLVSNVRSVKRVLMTFIGVVLSVGLFLYFSLEVGADRIVNALSVDGILLQFQSRFFPFILMLENYEWYNFIFGIGLGVPFEIPWFDYRDGMDVYNSNIDSMYLTFFVKFGVFFLMFITVFLGFFRVGVKRGFDKYIYLFVIIMSFVTATLYQAYSVGLFVGWYIIALLESVSDEKSCR